MRLYACITSPDVKRDKAALLSVARQFSYSIELLEDGILFDVSGLQNLVGDSKKISQKILEELKKNSVSGSIAVADTTDTATLLARGSFSSNPKSEIQNPKSDDFAQLPLENLLIENDTLNVFHNLGIKNISDLQRIPKDELINRYGQQFKNIIDVIEQKGTRLLTPNIQENNVSWSYQLDFPVDDFEQLVFILNHGLDKLLNENERYGFSTEHLDISFRLQNKTERSYEIKTSFPTLDKTFWLKLINLRISLDPPESEIMAIHVISHFTPPRPAQRGLYAVSRPDPEKLLLTVNKLKKLVGEENVGVPVLLDQRVANPFALDMNAIPAGRESVPGALATGSPDLGFRNADFGFQLTITANPQSEIRNPQSGDPVANASGTDSYIRNPVIAFSYFNPPISADVLVRDGKLIFIRTPFFKGHVVEYSGIWKANSKWWDRSWKTQEWDIEIENHGVYRLCKVGNDWFLAGEYD